MISQTAEYALRAIVHLADHPGEACTSESISVATKVPSGYLSKILQTLTRAGLIISQRGPNGGFTLTQSSARISVFDVVQAVDQFQRIHQCPLDLGSHGPRLCPLHRLLDDAALECERRFRQVSIGALLEESAGLSHPLCETRSSAPPTN